MSMLVSGSVGRCIWAVAFLAATLLIPFPGRAQDQDQADAPEQGGVSIEEVLVTATKKSEAEGAQHVPIALTAWNAEQLESRFTKDLHSLSYAMPNVALEDIGTIKGTANFSIRGLGVNSSIPSIDPTVGVFVDGMYLGVNAGMVFDLFDLDGIEVLRGPQGLLFGRNVTGGAVLVRTRRPTNDFSMDLKLATTDDYDSVAAGSISGPLVKDRLAARLTAYYNDDQGWFTNRATGNDYGASSTLLVRPSLAWTPTENVDLIVRYEHGEIDGDDGPASQNRALFDRHSFDFTVNEDAGYLNVDWDQAIAEFNLHVPFGDGTITNILGWRDYTSDSGVDIDGTLNLAFHARIKTLQDQLSDELRYAGRFGRTSLTAGLYWFTQDIDYFENRILAGGAVNSTLGGTQNQDTYGAFAQADIGLGSAFVLTLGARYRKRRRTSRSRRSCRALRLRRATSRPRPAPLDSSTTRVGPTSRPRSGCNGRRPTRHNSIRSGPRAFAVAATTCAAPPTLRPPDQPIRKSRTASSWVPRRTGSTAGCAPTSRCFTTPSMTCSAK